MEDILARNHIKIWFVQLLAFLELTEGRKYSLQICYWKMKWKKIIFHQKINLFLLLPYFVTESDCPELNDFVLLYSHKKRYLPRDKTIPSSALRLAEMLSSI